MLLVSYQVNDLLYVYSKLVTHFKLDTKAPLYGNLNSLDFYEIIGLSCFNSL